VDWIEHALGTDGGAFYHFYSGFGAAVGSITLLGGLLTFLTQRICQVDGCRGRGKMKVGEWTVCAGHHPDGAPTPEKIKQKYDELQARKGP